MWWNSYSKSTQSKTKIEKLNRFTIGPSPTTFDEQLLFFGYQKKEFVKVNRFRNMTDITVISDKVVDANYSRILRRKILLGWHEIILLFRTWNCNLKDKYTTILKTYFHKLVSAFHYVMTKILHALNVRKCFPVSDFSVLFSIYRDHIPNIERSKSFPFKIAKLKYMRNILYV